MIRMGPGRAPPERGKPRASGDDPERYVRVGTLDT